MELVFRRIDPDRYEEVYKFNLLHEYSYRDSSAQYTPDSDAVREQKTRRIVEQLKKTDDKYFCLAAFDSQEMIGAIFLNRMEIDNQTACHIHGLWVHSDYRKKGTAESLKIRGEAWAKRMGCKFMDTNVRVTNQKMIALNEKLGYEVARLNFRKNI